MKVFEYEGKKYLAFWGSVFSQWSMHGFEVYSNKFLTAEHYMMWSKAKLFNDEETAKMILIETDPKNVKYLGRKVKKFNQDIWDKNKFDIVVTGNFHKFKQNPEILEILKEYQDCIFVEGSPYDKIWGVGLHWQSEEIQNPKNWKGQNLLGKALNETVEKLKEINLI